MIETLPSADHVVAVKISGTLTGDEYDQLIAEVEAKLARHAKIGVLADLMAFKDVTPEAAMKDIRYDLSKLFQLKRFPREAVITDKHWMRTVARLASPLIPFVALRTFEPGQAEEALAWVTAVRSDGGTA